LLPSARDETSDEWHGRPPNVVLFIPWVCVSYASAPITPGKTIARIVLPRVSADVTSGQSSSHVFAVTIR
jgi:hypothetical protein